MGPLWIDLEGCELDAIENELLQHPTVGGVILFARNFYDSKQLIALNQQIRKKANRPILIGVDQEGGRVQRFKDGFTLLEPAQSYANLENGLALATDAGWLMAAELIAHDIDLSFAPVLDKGFSCKAIGNRAFAKDNQTIIRFSQAFMKGMKEAGMATTGKHFPGHGGVLADSHIECPIDDRQDIFENDMAIFKAQIDANLLDAVMPAHVVYSHYDNQPASGSAFWLKKQLRQKLGFKGIVFSDDLSMEGALIMGGPVQRCQKALDAGCDMLLLCNHRQSSIEVLDNLPSVKAVQANSLMKKNTLTFSELKRNKRWQETRDHIESSRGKWLEKQSDII